MNFFEVRRVRVRPAYAHLYPEIIPDVWLSAWRVTRLVRRAASRTGAERIGARVLSDEHFEFRGGTRGRQYVTGMWEARAEDVAVNRPR
jgi:hypothetical protein